MNKNKHFAKRSLSLLLIVLIAATALTMTACTDGQGAATTTEGAATTTTVATTDPQSVITELGKGETSFRFDVTGVDGKVTRFLVKTDEITVGQALINLNLIDGEAGPYGLYVKTVNGVTLDFNKDGKYWAFYMNGEYALTGVDSTNIEEGVIYEFKAE